MALTKNKNLKTLKQKTENMFLINHGIRNTTAYIEKQIYGFRFMKISLDNWDNFSMQSMILSFLVGGVAAFGAYWYRCESYYIVLYGAAGILSGLFMVLVDNGANISTKRQQLSDCLIDYVENSPHFYTQGHPVTQALRADGLRPSMYTQGHPVTQALQADGLRPSMYKNVDEQSSDADGDRKGKIPALEAAKPRIRDLCREERNGGKALEEVAAGEDDGMMDDSRETTERTGRFHIDKEKAEDLPQDKNAKFQPERPGGKFSVLSRKKQSRQEREIPSQESEKARSEVLPDEDELAGSIERLRESLEQIAASRESSRRDLVKPRERGATERTKKELRPEELKLLGEILQDYFS